MDEEDFESFWILMMWFLFS